MEYKCVGQEVTVVRRENRLQSGLSSRSQFQLQPGFKPQVTQRLSTDGASLWRQVVYSAPFIEDLKKRKDKQHSYHMTNDRVCVIIGLDGQTSIPSDFYHWQLLQHSAQIASALTGDEEERKWDEIYKNNHFCLLQKCLLTSLKSSVYLNCYENVTTPVQCRTTYSNLACGDQCED